MKLVRPFRAPVAVVSYLPEASVPDIEVSLKSWTSASFSNIVIVGANTFHSQLEVTISNISKYVN